MKHSPTSATGAGWERMPWHATQRAAWEALKALARASDEGPAPLAVSDVSPLTNVDGLIRAGVQSHHGFYPQFVTSRMEVNFSSVCSCKIE